MSFFEYCPAYNRLGFDFGIEAYVFEEIENAFVNSLLQKECLISAAADMTLFPELPFSVELSLPCDNGGGYYYNSIDNYSDRFYESRFEGSDSCFNDIFPSNGCGADGFFNSVFQDISDSCTDYSFVYSRNLFFDGEKRYAEGERKEYINEGPYEEGNYDVRRYGQENTTDSGQGFVGREKDSYFLRISLPSGIGTVGGKTFSAPSLISTVSGEFVSEEFVRLDLSRRFDSEEFVGLALSRAFDSEDFVGLDLSRAFDFEDHVGLDLSRRFDSEEFVGLDLSRRFDSEEFVGLALSGAFDFEYHVGFALSGTLDSEDYVGLALNGEQVFEVDSALGKGRKEGVFSERVFDCTESEAFGEPSDICFDLLSRRVGNSRTFFSQAYAALLNNRFFGFGRYDKQGHEDKAVRGFSSFDHNRFQYGESGVFSDTISGLFFPRNFGGFLSAALTRLRSSEIIPSLREETYLSPKPEIEFAALDLRNVGGGHSGSDYCGDFKSRSRVGVNEFFAVGSSFFGEESGNKGKSARPFLSRDFSFGNRGTLYKQENMAYERLAYGTESGLYLQESRSYKAFYGTDSGFYEQGNKAYETLAYGTERLAFFRGALCIPVHGILGVGMPDFGVSDLGIAYFSISQNSISEKEGRFGDFLNIEPSRKLQGAAVLWEKDVKKGFERVEGLPSISAPNMLFVDESGGYGADMGKLLLWENELQIAPEDVKKIRNASAADHCGGSVKAEIRVDMSGMKNIINKETDIDSLVADLTAAVSEAVAAAAEGVHSL